MICFNGIHLIAFKKKPFIGCTEAAFEVHLRQFINYRTLLVETRRDNSISPELPILLPHPFLLGLQQYLNVCSAEFHSEANIKNNIIKPSKKPTEEFSTNSANTLF